MELDGSQMGDGKKIRREGGESKGAIEWTRDERRVTRGVGVGKSLTAPTPTLQ